MARSSSTDEETGLTMREQQAACWIATGLNNHEVAEKMGCSTKTYDSHRAGALQKLHLRNNVELALWAIRKGWVDVNGRIWREGVVAMEPSDEGTETE